VKYFSIIFLFILLCISVFFSFQRFIQENSQRNQTLRAVSSPATVLVSIRIGPCSPIMYTLNGMQYSSQIFNCTVGEKLNIEINLTSIPENYTFHHWEDTNGFYSENVTIIYTVPEVNVHMTALIYPEFQFWMAGDKQELTLDFQFGEVVQVQDPHPKGIIGFLHNGTHLLTGSWNGLISLTTGDVNAHCENIEGCNFQGGGEIGTYSYFYPHETGLNGSYYYIPFWDETGYHFEIYDISDISNMPLVGSLSLTPERDGNKHMVLLDDWCYMLTNEENASILVVNISDPSNPTLQNNVSFDSASHTIDTYYIPSHVIYDNYIYFMFGEGIILVVNVTNRDLPTIAGSIVTSAPIQGSCVSGNYLFVAARNHGIQIYNVSTPSAPSYITTYNDTLEDCWDVTANGTDLYVADGQYGVHLLNITDVQTIQEIQAHPCHDLETCILLADDLLYVGDFMGTIAVYNISLGLDECNLISSSATSVDMNLNLFNFKFGYDVGGHGSFGGYCGGSLKSSFRIEMSYPTIDRYGKDTACYSHVYTEELIFYLDGDGDGIRGINTEVDANNSEYSTRQTCYCKNDTELGATLIEAPEVEVLPAPTVAWRDGNISLVAFKVSFNNTPIKEDGWDGSNIVGRVNLTYEYLVSIDYARGDVDLKMSMEFVPYNLNATHFPENFSVMCGYNSKTQTFFNRSSNSSGHFDFGGRPILGFNMEPNYTINRNSSLKIEDTAFSHRLSWWGTEVPSLITYPVSVMYGVNFVNVSEGNIVYYDPVANHSRHDIPLRFGSDIVPSTRTPPWFPAPLPIGTFSDFAMIIAIAIPVTMGLTIYWRKRKKFK